MLGRPAEALSPASGRVADGEIAPPLNRATQVWHFAPQRHPIPEIMVGPIAAQADWRNQRRLWKCLTFDQGLDPTAAPTHGRT